jgi:Fic family protein
MLHLLPLADNFKTTEILEKIILVNEALSNLDKEIITIPDYQLLLQPLTVREAVASNEIENIHTTTLEMLQAEILDVQTLPGVQKEVLNYKKALLAGYSSTISKGKMELEDIINIHCGIVPNRIGFRTTSGTVIGNRLGEVIYRPPQAYDEILRLMNNLMEFTNSDYEPLLKTIIAHYQFEAIHPFYDGNGRTGRILMALQFCLDKKLRFPVLYASGYILKNKRTYYELFREIQNDNNWHDWLIFHLNGIKLQAEETMLRLQEIHVLRKQFNTQINSLIKYRMRKNTLDLDTYFFTRAFYTQTNMSKELQIDKNTAKKYLEIMRQNNLLESRKAGKELLYFNKSFVDILS